MHKTNIDSIQNTPVAAGRSVAVLRNTQNFQENQNNYILHNVILQAYRVSVIVTQIKHRNINGLWQPIQIFRYVRYGHYTKSARATQTLGMQALKCRKCSSDFPLQANRKRVLLCFCSGLMVSSFPSQARAFIYNSRKVVFTNLLDYVFRIEWFLFD